MYASKTRYFFLWFFFVCCFFRCDAVKSFLTDEPIELSLPTSILKQALLACNNYEFIIKHINKHHDDIVHIHLHPEIIAAVVVSWLTDPILLEKAGKEPVATFMKIINTSRALVPHRYHILLHIIDGLRTCHPNIDIARALETIGVSSYLGKRTKEYLAGLSMELKKERDFEALFESSQSPRNHGVIELAQSFLRGESFLDMVSRKIGNNERVPKHKRQNSFDRFMEQSDDNRVVQATDYNRELLEIWAYGTQDERKILVENMYYIPEKITLFDPVAFAYICIAGASISIRPFPAESLMTTVYIYGNLDSLKLMIDFIVAKSCLQPSFLITITERLAEQRLLRDKRNKVLIKKLHQDLCRRTIDFADLEELQDDDEDDTDFSVPDRMTKSLQF